MMYLLRIFLSGLCICLAAAPALYAQDGGPRYFGRRGGNGGNWRQGNGGNGDRQPDPNDPPPAKGDAKSSVSSFSGSSDGTRAVSGFGVVKKHEMVSGFGASKKVSSQKTTTSNAKGEVKPANKAGPSPDTRLQDMIRQQAKSLLNQYDDNKNGKLEREEWSKMHRRHWTADQNHDGVITLDEMTAHLSQLNNVRAPVAVKADRRPGSTPPSSGSGAPTGSPYHFRSATERLPEGLPDWFAQKDADGDGQVTMAEYSVSWSEEKVREFRRFDLNDDGVITPKECLKAEGGK
jgi:Ca2+-binding EF-hand superfamily protein